MGNLVVQRKRGEEICIGENIIVTVLGSIKGKVTISVRAPDDVRIDRGEIRAKRLAGVPQENRLAAIVREKWSPKSSVAIAAGSTSKKGT